MRVTAVANQKGGCGKTTTSINFAACLALLQKKTLLLDLDPQGHSTCGLGFRESRHPVSLFDYLSPRRRPPQDPYHALVTVSEHFWMMPSYGTLQNLEEEWLSLQDREMQLKHFLEKLKGWGFEHVVLDCPPNLGLLTFNALEAADEILIPVEPSFFSLHGLAKISETIERTNLARQIPLQTFALLTLFNSEARLAQEIYQEVQEHFKERLFKTIIHEDVLLKDAAAAGKSIADYDRNSGAFRDYFRLAVEYLEKQWERILPSRQLGWDYVVQRHFGPKRVPGGVLFQALCRNARAVEIAGDFNNWIPESLLRRPDEGLWQKVLTVLPGTHRYKFIVDGEWQVDPFQPLQKTNAFGTFDSYLELV